MNWNLKTESLELCLVFYLEKLLKEWIAYQNS